MSRIPRRRLNELVSSAFLSGKSQEYSYPCIGEFKLSQLIILRIIPYAKNLYILSAITLVWIHIMCAIRENTDESNASYDARKSVKWLKSVFLGGGHALALASALATSNALGVLPSTEPVKIQEIIQASATAHKPNVKLPKQITVGNYPQWINGSISRILGLLNSCPAAIPGISKLGIQPGTAQSKSIMEISKEVPYPGKWYIPPENIIYELRIMFGIVGKDGRLLRKEPLIFDENPLSSKNKELNELGITYLEHIVFVKPIEIRTENGLMKVDGINFSRVPSGKDSPTADPKPQIKAFNREEAEKYLSSLELAAYDQASKIGNKKLLQLLNDKVKLAKANASKQNSTAKTYAVNVLEKDIFDSEYDK